MLFNSKLALIETNSYWNMIFEHSVYITSFSWMKVRIFFYKLQLLTIYIYYQHVANILQKLFIITENLKEYKFGKYLTENI